MYINEDNKTAFDKYIFRYNWMKNERIAMLGVTIDQICPKSFGR